MKFWLDELEMVRWKLFILNADEFLKAALVVSFSRLGIIFVYVYCSLGGGGFGRAGGISWLPQVLRLLP